MSSHPTPPQLSPDLAPFEPLIELLAHRIADILTTRLTPQASEGSSPWMLIDAAATHLGCSKHRLYKLTARGEIPHHKHDGRLFFHRPELDTWMAQHHQRQGPR